MGGKSVSVVIPVYNEGKNLATVLNSLRHQSVAPFEIIVVDDCSTDNSARIAKQNADVILIENESNRGPAVTRNRGIKQAGGELVALIDSDCRADADWIKKIQAEFDNSIVDAVMGNTRISKSSFLGDCISELGFPGGANAGFEKMWIVSDEGFTDHITSCNFIVRKHIFEKYGLFDESFPLAGGEDSELAHRWEKSGVKIRYSQEVLVWHEPRKEVASFLKWMIQRGRAVYQLKQKVPGIKKYIRVRLWSMKNILKKNLTDEKIFIILPLLLLSLIFQQIGFTLEKHLYRKRYKTR